MGDHPAIADICGKVAAMCGPVVYCLEALAAEGGEGIWIAGVFLPENIRFTARHEPEFLGGVTVLEGDALTSAGRDKSAREAGPAPESPEAWGDELYREFAP